MPIQFNCPKCHESYELDDDASGEKVECATCNHEFFVPDVPIQAPVASRPPTKAKPRPKFRVPARKKTVQHRATRFSQSGPPRKKRNPVFISVLIAFFVMAATMGTVWVLSEKQTKANIQTRSEPKKSRAAEVQVTYHVYLETSGRRLVPIRDTKITIYAWDESMREPLELVKTTNSAYNSELQKLNALHQKFFLAGKGSPTQVALARTQGNLSLIVEEMGNEKYDSQMALNRKLSSRVKSSKTNIDGKCKTNLKQGTYLAVVFRMAYMKYTINWFEKFEVTDEAKTVTLNHNNALIEQPPFDPFTGEFIRF